MKRREFLKLAGGGAAALVLGSGLSWLRSDPAYAAVQSLNFTITDAMKEMVTHNAINDARCYFWIYKCNNPNLPADCPGPNIFCTSGDTINITLTNTLDEPHAFFIQGVFDSGAIPPGATASFSFTAPAGGSYLYYDNLNAPVNRVMGLHGAFIVMPAAPRLGHKFTPYSVPTRAIQKLFDDLGSAAHWPGLAWEQGDPATDAVAFRQNIWVLHEASPVLFAEVGNAAPGTGSRVPATFTEAILNDPYANTFRTGIFNRKAHYFTMQGQSGHFSHNNPYICPTNRVGEPAVVRCLNAGMHVHSLHIHANHVYVLSEDGLLSTNLLWVDTMTARPLGGFDWLVPFMRPPDVPNVRGIGMPDTPMTSLANPLIPGSVPHQVWPPVEEINTFLPPVGTLAGAVDISVRLSPLCYPMHSHSEASQTAQGGNYNCGLISGIDFTGDRNTPGGVTTFPDAPTIHGPGATGPATVPF